MYWAFHVPIIYECQTNVKWITLFCKQEYGNEEFQNKLGVYATSEQINIVYFLKVFLAFQLYSTMWIMSDLYWCKKYPAFK